jgi:hypothetical protein
MLRIARRLARGIPGFDLDRFSKSALTTLESPMDDDQRVAVTAKINELLARSRQLINEGDFKGAKSAAREAVRLRKEMASATENNA